MYLDCGFGRDGEQANCIAASHSPAPHKAQPCPQKDVAGTCFTIPEVVSYISYTKVTLSSTDAPLFYTRDGTLSYPHFPG